MLLLLGQLHRKSYKWGVGTASTTSEIGYIEHQEACNQTSFLQWIYRYTAFKDRAFKEAHARPKIYPYECVKTSSGTHTHCCIHMHMHIIYSALVHYLLIWMPVLVCNSPSFVCVCVFHFDRFLQQGKPVSGRSPKNTQTLRVAPQAAAIASITSRKLSLATPTNHQAAQVQYELGQTKYV